MNKCILYKAGKDKPNQCLPYGKLWPNHVNAN